MRGYWGWALLAVGKGKALPSLLEEALLWPETDV